MTESKKSGWGSFLKGLVIEEVPQAQPDLPTPAAIPGNGPRTIHAAQGPTHFGSAPTVNPEIRARILQELIAEAPKGYQALNSAIETLADTLTDEGTLYKAAVKLANKQGHNLDRLVLDTSKCIQLMEEHKREFSAEMERQIQAKVGTKNDAIKNMENMIQTRMQSIAVLQEEIARFQATKAENEQAIIAETAQIEHTRTEFEAAHADVCRLLEGQKAKITTYGKV